jgi:hypothetical protein
VITAILVRTGEPDPYTSSNAETLLNQFRNHWNTEQAAIPRDLAQMFTGRSLDGGFVSIAWRGTETTDTVCGSYGYSVVDSDCAVTCDPFAFKTDLSAHALGLNWGASHCDCADPPYTMNPQLTGANQFHPVFTIPVIEAFRDTRDCLSLLGACCESAVAGGECEDKVAESDCMATRIQPTFYEGLTCDDPLAICEEHTGACCDRTPNSSSCRDGLLNTGCSGGSETWHKDQSCAEIDCIDDSIPTVSDWGVVITALLLLVGAKIWFPGIRSRV